MVSTPSYKITLFDNCELVVPAGLTCHKEGERLCIPGQMVAELSYQWTDEIEPVLLEIMDGLRIPAVGDACKKENGCDT